MFRTLDDLKKDSKNEKKDKKATQSFTGGEKSGLAVENPDDINGILQRAESNSRNKPEKPHDESAENYCVITLYRNGFQINEGPFRDYNAPENKKFMSELNKGYVPDELRNQYPKGLKVGIKDRKTKEFELPPPPKYIAFSGTGTSFAQNTSQPQTMEIESNVQAEPPKVDRNKPTTNVQLRLHNGKSEVIEVNLSTKVMEIFNYVWSLAPVSGEFELISGFPPKAITDVNLTVEEAGLEDSKIIQKLL